MKKWDIVLVFIYVLMTLAVTFAAFTVKDIQKDYDSKLLRIQVDGKVIKEMKIPITGIEEFDVKSENGFNRIKVDHDTVQVVDADCRDRICIHATPISSPGEIIVCLPHKTVLEIIGTKSDDGVDATAY